MNSRIARLLANAFRRVTMPLAAYYGIALAVPLANGAAHRGASFWKHALVVAVMPPIWIVLVSTVCEMFRAWVFSRVNGRILPSPP